MQCFSIDRFVSVSSESELEKIAFELNQKKMFYSGIYFNNVSRVTDKEYSYKIRMDVDNTPVTLENRNRFWFPGPNANFDLDMKYHRGYIQLQYAIDRAIIQTIRYHETLRLNKERAEMTTIMSDYEYNSENSAEGNDSSNTTTVATETTTSPETSVSEPSSSNGTERSLNLSSITIKTIESDGSHDLFNFKDDGGSIHDGDERQIRRKREFDDLNFDIDESAESTTDPDAEEEFHFNEFEMYTKQFPYPKYKKDLYVTGIYLGQAIQMTFFFALIVQVSASVRQRIWTKESGNSTVNKTNICTPSEWMELILK